MKRYFKFGNYIWDMENPDICAPFGGEPPDSAVQQLNTGLIRFSWVPVSSVAGPIPPEFAQKEYHYAIQILGEDYFK